MNREIAFDILKALERGLGVGAIQLRGPDRLDVELQDASSCWIDDGYRVSHMIHDVAIVLCRHGAEDDYDPVASPQTIRELICSADEFLKACERGRALREKKP